MVLAGRLQSSLMSIRATIYRVYFKSDFEKKYTFWNSENTLIFAVEYLLIHLILTIYLLTLTDIYPNISLMKKKEQSN